ncbi:MAG: DNA-processing protein DprA, partial [Pseudomonadota bacterium]
MGSKNSGRSKDNAHEILDWLQLFRSEHVGPITFKHLLGLYGSAGRALEALPQMARQGGRKRPLKIASRARIRAELEALKALGGVMITMRDSRFPRQLLAIEDCPPILSLLGHPHLLERPMIAMVGARNASINGKNLAKRLAEDFARAGFVVVSGMARGIDGASHHGALAGGTVAVLAGGVDSIYPPEHEALYQQLVAQGLIVSEMPIGAMPKAHHFPRRNRIISGLASGLVVVEANLRSGSLIKARLAADQGREVFAVPGPPYDARARGCNALLREGAILLESADDAIPALRRIVEKLDEYHPV